MRFDLSRVSRTVVLLGFLLSSCALVGAPRRVPFNEADFATYRGTGSSTVAGQLVVTSDDGEKHIGDGTHVTLLPVAAYTKEMVDREIGNGDNLAPSDPRFRQYMRLVTTDGQGNFVFKNVPAGEYFVAGLGEWYVGDDAQYQWACERVTVGKGQTVKIKLSRNLQRPGSPTLVIWALE
ncbi:MAG TPA: hypothetical protein VGM54_05140 [Chthoniobacter sp.]|jgi:hypothetical protein